MPEGGVNTNVMTPFESFFNDATEFANFNANFPGLNFNDAALYPNGIANITIAVVPVPEPVTGALGLLSLGTVGFVTRRRFTA